LIQYCRKQKSEQSGGRAWFFVALVTKRAKTVSKEIKSLKDKGVRFWNKK